MKEAADAGVHFGDASHRVAEGEAAVVNTDVAYVHRFLSGWCCANQRFCVLVGAAVRMVFHAPLGRERRISPCIPLGLERDM